MATDDSVAEAENTTTQAQPESTNPEQPTPEQAPAAEEGENTQEDGADNGDDPSGASAPEEGASEPEAGAEEPQAGAETPKVAKPDGKARRGTPRVQLDDLVIGSEAKGKVMATAKFGVFVDIGAVTDGLVHVSEFPKKRVQRVEDEVAQGDLVDVWIKDVDKKGNRISLSMRTKPTRPMSSLQKGDVLSGSVTSITKYGAFVEIGSETEGLVHISEMSSGFVEKPAEVASVGDTVEVRVKEVDQPRERISLSMVGLANDTGSEPTAAGAKDEEEQGEQERMPTVVELALRKALGDLQETDEVDVEAEEPVEIEEPAEVEVEDEPDPDPEPDPDRESLGEVYERMLEEYRQSKQDE